MTPVDIFNSLFPNAEENAGYVTMQRAMSYLSAGGDSERYRNFRRRMGGSSVPDDYGPLSEPTPDQCNQNTRVEWKDESGQIRHGFALWYPQMGGYAGRVIVEGDGEDDGGCFTAYVWHDGDFPFSGDDDNQPRVLHHCSAWQFAEFARSVDDLLWPELDSPDLTADSGVGEKRMTDQKENVGSAVSVHVGDSVLTQDLVWCECGRGLGLNGRWKFCPNCGGRIDQASYEQATAVAIARGANRYRDMTDAEDNIRLRQALQSLTNEACRFLEMADFAAHGLTNIAVMARKIEMAQAALAAKASE